MMGSGFGFGIPGLGMIVVWGLLIVLLIWLARAIAAGARGGGKGARQILDERYARGEINRHEYEEKRRLLG